MRKCLQSPRPGIRYMNPGSESWSLLSIPLFQKSQGQLGEPLDRGCGLSQSVAEGTAPNLPTLHQAPE